MPTGMWPRGSFSVRGLPSMDSPTIIGTGPLDQTAIDILAPYGQFIMAPDPTAAALMPLLDHAVGLAVRGEGAITAEVIAAAKHLKVIGRTGVGYDNVDIQAATARRIPVVYTPGVNANAVAEAALAMMLALCKRVVYWDRQLKAGNWNSRRDISNEDLEGATLGIIGFGRIGQALAKRAQPFGMTVIAHDPFEQRDAAERLRVSFVTLDQLLGEADFICLHAAQTPDNRGLINRARLQRVKRGAYLINLARGGLIESLDVLDEALADGRLAGVGLDVFDPEPPLVEHRIFQREQCLTAPHALGMTRGVMAKVFQMMAEDMAAVLNGQRPRNVVNPEVL
jgi:D-3-phosphoglycerate dehydrogenase